jgi:Ser/Thr protein kinase RdoA (MazF antagonist)
MRVHVRNGAPLCDVFIKTFVPPNGNAEARRVAQERLLREYEALVRLNDAVAGHPDMRVSRPVACFPEELCIVTEQVPGMTLRGFLNECAPWRFGKTAQAAHLEVFERVGTWLRVFQKLGRTGHTVSLSGMRNELDWRLKLLIEKCRGAFNSTHRAAVLRHFDELSRQAGTPEFAEVGVHADFCPDNVLVVKGSEIVVLDFEMLCTGAMYSDLSHMYMHMSVQKAKPWIGADAIHELQRAMLRGFDPTLKAEHPMFQAALLVNVVYHFAAIAGMNASRAAAMQHRFLWRNHWRWLKSLDRPPSASLRKLPAAQG